MRNFFFLLFEFSEKKKEKKLKHIFFSPHETNSKEWEALRLCSEKYASFLANTRDLGVWIEVGGLSVFLLSLVVVFSRNNKSTTAKNLNFFIFSPLPFRKSVQQLIKDDLTEEIVTAGRC